MIQYPDIPISEYIANCIKKALFPRNMFENFSAALIGRANLSSRIKDEERFADLKRLVRPQKVSLFERQD